MGVSTPSTLMLTSMRVTNPKFVKSDRKPKKTKHYIIPKSFDKRRRTKRVPEKELS